VCGVEVAEGLQEVTEEWEVRGECMTSRSGPRVVWLLGRKAD
jgi:hypothetical protein